MPATAWGWLISPDELQSWIVADTPDWLLVNKPAHVVCHPSKHGPWSSLIGACRTYLALDRLHLPSRLDRETSGVVVLAKNASTASRLQSAIERRQVTKTYHAILTGHLLDPVTVTEPIARDEHSPFYSRQWVSPEGQPAETEFVPLAAANGFTFARVHPRTGRRHQIRVHAAWLGHSLVGDKLYGPDPSLMFEFMAHGFTPGLAESLPLDRQALHATALVFHTDLGDETFTAPLSPDLIQFCRSRLALTLPLDGMPERGPAPS